MIQITLILCLPISRLPVVKGQASPYSRGHVWSGCCHRAGSARLRGHRPTPGGERGRGAPPWAHTSKASPRQSGRSCCQAGHGLLGRDKCCIHPQGLPCTFNWRCDASWGTAAKSKNPPACTRLTSKNKGLLFCETSQEKLKSNELSGVSSFKNIYGNSTVC